MQRFAIGITALGILAGAALLRTVPLPEVAVSGETGGNKEFQARVADRNPWSSLPLNNQRRDFQFVIVTDRTGGHRPGVFADAVRKINLLQPEFVVSVGDLIEGGTEDKAQWALEWAEFQGKVQQLQMPFFYVPGNHDISNAAMTADWNRKFGRSYYEFRYHDVLFLALNSEDTPKVDPGRFTPEQQRWAVDVLERNKDARWTIVLLHKPFWTYPNVDYSQVGWTAIEQALGDRNYTVFAGHKHNYARTVRNGRDYIMLATTGGSSKLRGRADGEFDHVVWVTMKDSGPIIANIMLDGIADKNIRNIPEAQPKAKQAATAAK